LEFSNGEKRVFDVKPYLNKGIFIKLQNDEEFNSAHVENGTVVWNGWQDFCPDTLYSESIGKTSESEFESKIN
jgi:hypothetical protein